MFGLNSKHLEKRCAQLEVRVTTLLRARDELEDNNYTLKVENTKLSDKREMAEEKIAHKIKMREEQVDLDYLKKLQEKEKKMADNIAAVKDTYRDKVEKQLEKRGDELKGMYSEILAQLPDVSLAIKQKS